MRTVRTLPLLLLVIAVAGCGKKGAPLPPLLRVPGMVGDPIAMRVEDEVFVRFQVPARNVDGVTPADIARIEVYAITASRPPTEQDDPADVRRLSTLVAAEQVRPPLPPMPPAARGEPQSPAPPPLPGVDQGSELVVRETLTAAAHEEIRLPDLPGERRDDDAADALPGPLVAPRGSGVPTRYYYAVGVSPRGRYGPLGPIMPVPLGPTSGAPDQPQLSHDESSITIRWLPPRDARGLGLEPSPDALPSKPIIPGPPPTTYDVFEVPPGNASAAMPTPLTSAPVGELALTGPLGAFGIERCFFVRSVDIVDGHHVRGPASPTVCITPKDTYAPRPPHSLAAVATEAAINLIWEPSESADVAGYLVLRARLPDDTLQAATEAPISGTTFVDRGVRPGVTYAYVVVAVDQAGNRSEPSNRVEETARQ